MTAIGKEQMQQGCFNDHSTVKIARSMESLESVPLLLVPVQ